MLWDDVSAYDLATFPMRGYTFYIIIPRNKCDPWLCSFLLNQCLDIIGFCRSTFALKVSIIVANKSNKDFSCCRIRQKYWESNMATLTNACVFAWFLLIEPEHVHVRVWNFPSSRKWMASPEVDECRLFTHIWKMIFLLYKIQ